MAKITIQEKAKIQIITFKILFRRHKFQETYKELVHNRELTETLKAKLKISNNNI